MRLVKQWTIIRNEIKKNGGTTTAHDRLTDRSKYTELYNRLGLFVPETRKNSWVTPKMPWLSSGLLKSWKTKDKMYIKYKLTSTEASTTLFNIAINSKRLKHCNKLSIKKIITIKRKFLLLVKSILN